MSASCGVGIAGGIVASGVVAIEVDDVDVASEGVVVEEDVRDAEFVVCILDGLTFCIFGAPASVSDLHMRSRHASV